LVNKNALEALHRAIEGADDLSLGPAPENASTGLITPGMGILGGICGVS